MQTQTLPTLARTAAVIAASLLTATAFAQSTFSSSQLNRPAGGGGPSVNEFISNPIAPMVRSISDPPNGSASSYGEANFAVLKASAVANAQSESLGVFFARSNVGFTDNFTFASAGLNGAAGFMNVTLDFQRLLSFTGAGAGGRATDTLHAGTNFWSYDFMETYMLQPSGCVPGAPGGCAPSLTTQTSGGDSATWLSGSLVSLRVPITFGVSNSFSLGLNMTALAAYYQGESSWSADASHSLYWGGISSVTDANGNAVDFALASGSGTNYLKSFIPGVVTAPVPEPETYALMLAGLGFLGYIRRRRVRTDL